VKVNQPLIPCNVLWSDVITGNTGWRDGSTKYVPSITSTKDVVLVPVTHLSHCSHFQPKEKMHMPDKSGPSKSTDRTKHVLGKSGCQNRMIVYAQTTLKTKHPVTNIPIQRKIWVMPHL